jgi:CheY-specific phosphatase CheX
MSSVKSAFGIETVPEHLEQLSRLIKVTDTASIDEIIEIISADPKLAQRTKRIALNGRDNTDEITLEVAVNRLGVGIVEVLAMGNLLTVSVLVTFRKMLGSDLTIMDASSKLRRDSDGVIGSIEFNGEVFGKIYLDFPSRATKQISSRLTGLPYEDIDEEIEKDSVGELVNIICGQLQSNICDAGLSCHLGLPVVDEAQVVSIDKISGARKEVFAFKYGEDTLWIDFLINPYANR